MYKYWYWKKQISPWIMKLPERKKIERSTDLRTKLKEVTEQTATLAPTAG